MIQPADAALPPVPHAPSLSTAFSAIERKNTIVDEQGLRRPILVPTERPLMVYLDGLALVTLMTVGGRPERLVLDYLRNPRR